MKKFLQINRMKSKFAFLTGLLLFFGIKASAYDFEADGIFYNIEQGVENQVSVTSGSYSYEGDIVIPSSVNYNNIDYSVTSIGQSAFCWCSSLTSVIIPESVTSIGYRAFEGCSSLTSVVIPESVTSIEDRAFVGCSSLTSIVIPESVTSIGDYAFMNCSSLTSVVIPESVTSIGGSAFFSCSSLTSIVIPESVTSIGQSAFSSCISLTEINVSLNNDYYASLRGVLYNKDLTVILCCPSGINISEYVIPESVTSIGDYAFEDCSSLTSVVIPESVTSIGHRAFYHCSSLTSVVIPESVTSIGDYAFMGCGSLKSVVIPESVTSIGIYAFSSCISLTSVVIPESVISIGQSAFSSCISLKEINVSVNNDYYASLRGILFNKKLTVILCCPSGINISEYVIPESVTSIGDYAFEDCSSLTSVVIPESVTSIGDYAFLTCISLTSVVIPESVTSIGQSAFNYCSSLTSVVIPESVTSIGMDAFRQCSSLTSVVIPESVTSIGSGAFSYCSSLKDVTCRALVVPELGGFLDFGYIDSNAVLYVYESVVEDYKNSNWAQYFSQILPIKDIVEVISIEISPEGEQEMTEGATMVFTATVLPENATDATVVWTTNNEEAISIEVSDVDPNIITVTALETGEATLTATAADGSGVSTQVSIIVKAPQTPVTPATKVEITGFYSSILYLGSSVTLSAIVSPEDATYKEVIWETSNPEVLTVDEEGYVSAVGLGTAKISVAIASDLTVSDSIEITVMEDSQSGIAGFTPDADGLYKVYSMAGNLVLSTKDPSKLKDLENGLYIINGKKVLLRQD